MDAARDEAIALAPAIQLALRGAAGMTSYATSSLPQVPDDLLFRVTQLYNGDPQLHRLWRATMQARSLAICE